MLIALVGVVGFGLGSWVVYVLLERRRQEAKAQRDQAVAEAERARRELVDAKRHLEKAHRLERELAVMRVVLDEERGKLESDQEEFRRRAVAYRELEQEKRLLKRDLLNLDVANRKLRLDHELQAQAQERIDRRSGELAERFLLDTERWVANSITANNYAACKQRLVKAIEWCREIGFDVSREREDEILDKLRADYEAEVRRALEREEQARIRARIREEQQREREIQKELQAIEREKAVLEAALAKASALTQDAHSAEIAQLQARLAEAEARQQRAISQAQLTKAGHLYVISNIGSFGENVYKIGMTRRLEPLERISELGDASVPFPFDVHMMISCDDAPALEAALHREFHKFRVNRVNPRKEYFRVDLNAIKAFVESRHGEVRFMAEAEASEYRQSLSMSDEDQEFVEQVFDETERKLGLAHSEE